MTEVPARFQSYYYQKERADKYEEALQQIADGEIPDPAAFAQATLDEKLVADRLTEAEEALRVIESQDPVELALDPQWSQRIARAALAGGEGE